MKYSWSSGHDSVDKNGCKLNSPKPNHTMNSLWSSCAVKCNLGAFIVLSIWKMIQHWTQLLRSNHKAQRWQLGVKQRRENYGNWVEMWKSRSPASWSL